MKLVFAQMKTALEKYPIIQFQYDVIRCLVRAKLKVNDPIHAKLFYPLQSTRLQMLSHLQTNNNNKILNNNNSKIL